MMAYRRHEHMHEKKRYTIRYPTCNCNHTIKLLHFKIILIDMFLPLSSSFMPRSRSISTPSLSRLLLATFSLKSQHRNMQVSIYSKAVTSKSTSLKSTSKAQILATSEMCSQILKTSHVLNLYRYYLANCLVTLNAVHMPWTLDPFYPILFNLNLLFSMVRLSLIQQGYKKYL